MYEDGYYAKLADFGLARQYEHSRVSASKYVGTSRYWAPELHKEKPVQYKSDMFCLGQLLYFMMTGFVADIDSALTPPREYSQGLLDLCEMLLKKDPEERPMVRELFAKDIIIQTLLSMLSSGKIPRKKE